NRLITQADLQRHLVEHRLQGGRGRRDLSVAATQLTAVLTAAVQRLVDVDSDTFDPGVERAGRVGAEHGAADIDLRQEFATSRLPAAVGLRDGLVGHRYFTAVGRRIFQTLLHR